MKSTTTIILTLLLVLFQSEAQQKNVRENVYLHTNTTTLLTGESLLFKAYVTSDFSGEFSQLSKILYVEMIDAEKNPVFQQKLDLDNGRGYGDFFVPTTLNTGTYYLLAYTRWMKNFDDFFVSPVNIINPFEPYRANTSKDFHLYSEQGKPLVSGLTNRIHYRFENIDENTRASARIVDHQNNTISTIIREKDGANYGYFEIEPEVDINYQMILDFGSGSLEFREFPLEVRNEGCLLKKGRNDQFTLRCNGTRSGAYTLEVWDSQNLLYQVPISTNSPTSLPVNSLPKKLLHARVLTEDSELIISQPIQLNEIEVNDEIGQKMTSGTRQKVEIPLQLPSGYFSISVRKSDEAFHSRGQNAKSYTYFENQLQSSYLWESGSMFLNKYRNTSNDSSINFLPEYRGEILTGTFSSAGIENLEDQVMTFSTPGEYFQVKSGILDEDGNFFINYIPPYENTRAYLQVVGDTSQTQLEVENKFLNEYPDFKTQSLQLDSLGIRQVIQRSIRNQIENAYYTVKEDSIPPFDDWVTQYENFHGFYNLDDYNRFPTVEDYFIEYILKTRVRRIRNQPEFLVSPDHIRFNDQRRPLLTIDGVPTTTSNLLSYNPYKIKSVGIINKRYYLGPVVTDGVIDIRTYQGYLDDYRLDDNTQTIDVLGITPRKVYSSVDPSSTNYDKLPDYRDQLLWIPDYQVDTDEINTIRFYTSETKGDFELIIEGFSNGNPISHRQLITVK